ncbi:MAG TPA: hypothetical protein VFC84_01150 [Desulfosporosinus sp.]|nr:hypothetical protein [Desulfosporosinus sp.]
MNLSGMSFILLPLMIFIIVIVIRDIVPFLRTRMSGLLTWKRSFICAGLYVGILVLMVPMLYVLPNEGFIKVSTNSNQANTLYQNVLNDLFNPDDNFPLDFYQQEGLYKNSSKTFKAETNKLAFNSDPNTNLPRIFVERKAVDDGEINVSTYAGTQSVGGIDITKLIVPPAMSFNKGTLSFPSNNQQVLNLKKFNPDFTVDQFKNGISESMNSSSWHFGFGQVIYIRVPKSLEIDTGAYSHQIQMISGKQVSE